MIVYISGPMTGYVDYNRDAFFAAEKHLTAKGFKVVNPAALDVADGSDQVIQPHSYYMRRDLSALLDCDLIYLLPGWRYSKGAITEKTVADVCGILRLEDPEVETWRSFEGEIQAPEQEDLSPETPESVGASEVEDGDLSDHPRFGSVFADFDYAVDDSLPPNTVRLNYGCGDIDLVVSLDETNGLRLRTPLDEVSAVRPGDSFPDVGYVRRFKRLLGVEG